MRRNFLEVLREFTRLFAAPAEVKTGVQLEAFVLEDRVLYSATALPVDMDPSAASGVIEVSQTEIDSILALIDAELNSDSPSVSTTDPAHANDLIAAPRPRFCQPMQMRVPMQMRAQY